MSEWSTQQLTELLSVVAAQPDPEAMARRAVEHVAEAFEAEVAALVLDGRLVASTGFAAGRVPGDELVALATARHGELAVPGVGACPVAVAAWDERPGLLLVARAGDGYARDEHGLLRAMARVVELSWRAARVLDDERRLRTHADLQATENAVLLSTLQERQALLERLSRIQRSISSRKPLAEVLDTIVAGAAELLDEDIVALRLLDPDDPGVLVVASSLGVPAALVEQSRRSRVTEGVGGRAVVEERLVATGAYDALPQPIGGFVADGITCAMGAPVRQGSRVVGSLTVASRRRGRAYSISEQEVLTAFAEHAGLALNDARTVEALHLAAERATQQATHDGLTGLPNRRLFLERLRAARQRRQDDDSPLSVLFLDVDDFKVVNDSLGHLVGDRLLTEVGQRLVACLRDGDTVSRLGGDEFAVLVEGAPVEAVVRSAERVLLALSEPFLLDGREAHVGASVGVVVDDGTAASPEELLRDADVAMYCAKHDGKRRLTVFEPAMRQRLQARSELEADLRRAVAAEEFVLHYQPVVDLVAGQVVGVEALLRWSHPRRGLVPPAEFIPLAEETGLIVPLGAFVLREACRQAAVWAAHGGPRLHVSVNLSPRQLQEPDLADVVASALRSSGLPASRLVLEITESLFVDDLDTAATRLHRLKAHGVGLAVDDFGTGYSSLSYLGVLPVDVLKVDRAFVAGITDGRAQGRLAGAVVALAHSLDLQTVAEGVETEEQAGALLGLGARLMQGYLYAPPTPAGALPGVVRALEARLAQRVPVQRTHA